MTVSWQNNFVGIVISYKSVIEINFFNSSVLFCVSAQELLLFLSHLRGNMEFLYTYFAINIVPN